MIVKDAMYSWWVRPLAVDDGTYLWLGTVDRRGANVVRRVDGSTVDQVTLSGPGEVDDHNAVALAVDPTQDSVICAYSRHNKDQHVRVQRVDRDTLAPEAQQQLGMGGTVSYAQLVHHSSTVHVLCRVSEQQWRYRSSTDWGETWGPAKVLMDGVPDSIGKSYITTRVDPADPALVHVAIAGHPTLSDLRKVHYGQLHLDTGDVTKVSGTVLGNLADSGGPELPPSDWDTVADPSSGSTVRTLDVGVIDGAPALAYAVWPDNGSSEPIYRVKRRSATGWPIVDWSLPTGPVFGHTPTAHYHGGLSLGSDGATIRTSRKAGSDWVVEQWSWTGSTFTLDEEVSRSKIRRIRPHAVIGGSGWLHQDTYYEHYTRWYGDVVVS